MENDYLNQLTELVGIKFLPCKSSNLEGYAYNSHKQELWIAFKGNRVYKYKKVPYTVCNQLAIAKSKGTFHSQNIKGKYDYEGFELK